MYDDSSLGWRKATYSGGNGGNCVEVGNDPGTVLVRDTTQNGWKNRIVLNMPSSAWQRFTDGIKQAQ